VKIENFEEIEAWKEARCLVKDIYRILSGNKDFGFRDQIQRAAVSVMTNIAEGFDRGSNKEFCQYLVIARGSLSEVKSLSYVAHDIGYIDQAAFDSIHTRCLTLANLINGFIRFLRTTSRTR